MQKCLNSTLGARMPDAEDFSVSSLPSFVFSAKNCEDFDAVRKCVIEELEKCEKSTPANIVDAFFKFLKKQMSCDAKVAAVGQRSSSWLTTSSTLLVLVSSLLLKVYH
ncbi:hypothetical protein NQ317_007781 [Molorchus minor]|uniref:Uncharacterized protein n=1 Tax=Molorchus minor TaxID=1323400 RepID=A0ABQ9JYJ6_9CUCU|nr:hypothetical protein NQ317_007781 [Molorchus minor]